MFDVEGARKAGYTDAEIAAHLASSRQFDVEGARKAGYSDSELIAYLSGAPLKGQDAASQIPGGNVEQPQANPEPKTLGEKLKAAGELTLQTMLNPVQSVKDATETGLSVGTGLTGGGLGMASGTVQGMVENAVAGRSGTPEAAQHVEQRASQGADLLTYKPQSPNAREAVETIGKGMQQVIPAAPILPGLVQPASRAASNARPAMQTASEASAAVLRDAAKAAEEHLAKSKPQEPAQSGAFGADSVGAARVGAEALSRAKGEELGFTGNSALTKGQTQKLAGLPESFEQYRFEGEHAKDPVKGQKLRERAANQHAQVWNRFDQWVDETGATKFTDGEVGDAVTSALRKRAARDKTEIRVSFAAADKSPEAQRIVDVAKKVSVGEGDTALTSSPIEFINSKPSGLKTTALTDHARKYAVKLGIADEVDGQLVARPATVKQMHEWRKEINAATGYEPAEIQQATVLKKLIDAQTNEVAGPLYQRAYGLRARFAQNYENIGLIYDLMNSKRGMSDARVAAEKVFQRSVLSASFQEMRQLRRILQTGGEDGAQAWRELQGATVRYIREQAARNVTRNELNQEMVSAKGLNDAVTGLDKTGKLDFIFGKRGGEQVRALNDLAKVLFTAPPGAINTSNTASVILAALDMATSGVAGMPLPIMSGLRILTTHVRDRQIQKRINDALGIKPEPKKVKAPVSVIPKRTTPDAARMPESRTVH